VRVAAPGFLPALAAFAKARGLLLIVDEIYTGLGRSGALFAHREQDCEADLICIGKALGGGFPISACLGREEVMAAWGDPAGEAIHTSTFLGNPPASAAALATLAEIDAQAAPTLARARGQRLRDALSAVPGLTVQGRGLFLGVRVPERNLLGLCHALLMRGYIVLPAGAPPSVLALTPPLCLSDAQIDGFTAALREALAEPA
jgi:4-aminobutyrate aminotransferase/(S)-3-amino-2-methylpropionate transaminase